VWRLTMADSKLWADFEGFPLELRALSPMEFEPVNYAFETRLKFEQIIEKSSVRRRLTVKQEMELPTTFEVIEEARPSVAELGAYAGDYWSDELRATYSVRMKDEKLWLKDMVGGDGIVHHTIPFDELRPLLADEFDLRGAPIVIDFKRDQMGKVNGFTLNGFHERGIAFVRRNAE
jgi:hypothetical protein